MRRLRLRFGVGFLLLLPLWVAGYLSGIRYRSSQMQHMQAMLDGAITSRTYDVADIVSPDYESLKNLCSLIEATIDGKWEFRNDVSLGFSSVDRTLSVTQTGAVHARIEDLLQQVRARSLNSK